MPILGSVIKSLIEVKDSLTPESNPLKEQEGVLRELLKKAERSSFGEAYNFTAIGQSNSVVSDFKKSIPYFDYNKMQSEWWKDFEKGVNNLTWPGQPSYFALSSGTTGNGSKRIPVTDEMLDAIRKAGIKQISALSNFDLSPEFFEKEIMMLGSSTDLEERKGHLEGEISGISASNIPFWFRSFYKPGEKIAGINDWDERVEEIAKNARKWDIGALSGIPSWMELMMRRVIEYNGLKNIHEIWPNLKVFASGGVAFSPYEKSFNSLLEHPITIIDTYLASEGFLAYQERPETESMKLITDNGIYFEFIPFESQYINVDGSVVQNAPSLGLGEVVAGKEYILIISTVSGLWRYSIGDTIEFTDVERAEIKITGRTKFFMNVVGSQLSVNKMNDGMKHLEKKFDISIPEFTLAAIRLDGKFFHKWYLGCDHCHVKGSELADQLDTYFKKANKNYGVARSKSLEGIIVKVVPTKIFNEWQSKNKKKGGQVKMEKVMDEDKFKEWEKFVQNFENI